MNYNDTRDHLLKLQAIDALLARLPMPRNEACLIPGNDTPDVDPDSFADCRDAARRNLRIMANDLMMAVYPMSDPLFDDLDTMRRSINK